VVDHHVHIVVATLVAMLDLVFFFVLYAHRGLLLLLVAATHTVSSRAKGHYGGKRVRESLLLTFFF
jgi:hypothetical protein